MKNASVATAFVVVASLVLAGIARADAGSVGKAAMDTQNMRIVCLGDSITDGYTYGQIIMQALKDAGKPVPTIISAGVASDTAALMQARFDRDVLSFEPALVTFNAGTNDALHGVTADQYEASLRDIVQKCKDRKIPIILLTPCIINPASRLKDASTKPDATTKAVKDYQDATTKAAAGEEQGQEYLAVIRKVAAEFNLPVAECNKLQREARAAGKEIMSPDGIHPNYFGQSLMAQSILDAMGLADIALPKEFKPTLFPGVIRQWKMRPLDEIVAAMEPTSMPATAGADGNAAKAAKPVAKPKLLTAEIVAALKIDENWKDFSIPSPAERPTSAEEWLEQIRRNGFGVGMDKAVGKGTIVGVATIQAEKDKKVYISVSTGVHSLYLNGKNLWTHPCDSHGNETWAGFHAGKERIEVQLPAGPNTLVAEFNAAQFFVSVNDKRTWEEDYAKTIGD